MSNTPLINERFSRDRIQTAFDAYLEPLQLRGHLGSAEPGVDIRVAEGLNGAAMVTIRLDFEHPAPRMLFAKLRQDQAVVDATVAAATKEFLRSVTGAPSNISDALVDKPKAGTKARAREAFKSLLEQIHRLRMAVYLSNPPQLVASEATKLPDS